MIILGNNYELYMIDIDTERSYSPDYYFIFIILSFIW